MKSGDIFTLDAQSVEEVAKFAKTPLVDVQKKCAAGDVYSVAKSDAGIGDVVRGSRWVDGKPKKGRPRRFPRSTVLRLLGEVDTRPTAEEVAEASETVTDKELESQAIALLNEEKAAAASSW